MQVKLGNKRNPGTHLLFLDGMGRNPWNHSQERGIGAFPELLLPGCSLISGRGAGIFFPLSLEPFSPLPRVFIKIRDHGVGVVIPDAEPSFGNDFIKMSSERANDVTEPLPIHREKKPGKGKGRGGKRRRIPQSRKSHPKLGLASVPGFFGITRRFSSRGFWGAGIL